MSRFAAPRHSWRQPVRFPLKSERTCRLCGMVRVTRHDAGGSVIPWVEFWRFDGVRQAFVRVEARGTPSCEPAGTEGA